MRLTFVGHATWLAQKGATSVLMDPNLMPSFRHETFKICPTRKIDPRRMPRLDAIFLSHRHRDHFDLDTLARLDRSATVYCPVDPVILHALRRLGYRRVVTVRRWDTKQIGPMRLQFTPSQGMPDELGILLSDGDVSFWNHVDTVMSGPIISKVLGQFRKVDLVAHDYQPMLETAALEGDPLYFPAGGYRTLLQNACLLAPKAIVPASNGYRVTGPHAWFNAFKFPISRERFVRDMRRALPQASSFIPNPGDVLEIRPGGTKLERQAAPNQFVRTVSNDASEILAFNPMATRPSLRDYNPRDIPIRKLHKNIRQFFGKHVPSVCRTIDRRSPMRKEGAVYEFRIVYPDRTRESWNVDFSAFPCRVRKELLGDRTDFILELGASTLVGLITGHTRGDIVSLSGQYRSFSRAYSIRRSSLAPLESLSAWNLLGRFLYFRDDAEVRLVDCELDRLLNGAKNSDRPFWIREMQQCLS